MAMLTKNDFSPVEWNSLREVPQLVGLATLVAGASGLGTVKESVAMAQGIIEGQSSNVALVRDLTNRVEMQEVQNSLGKSLGTPEAQLSKERMKSIALEHVTAAMSLLEAKASAEEISAVRQWLYAIAEKVANAAKEGGFLGFGGTRVSEDEQAFLTELKSALHLPVGTT
jgi:hypothetical protein